jgi:putative phosphoribosyl transferase
MVFQDRVQAGRELAKRLRAYANNPNVIVLGIPRGGVPVALQVAEQLHAPLDIFVVRKLGVPGREELAFGAIASGGVRFLDWDILNEVEIRDSQIERIVAKEQQELARRERAYRDDCDPINVRGKIVILIDDGIATGSSMLASVRALKQMEPARIVIGVPVAPVSTYTRLISEVDEIICVETPESFYAVGQFYEDFSQVTDKEVTDLLHDGSRPHAGRTP